MKIPFDNLLQDLSTLEGQTIRHAAFIHSEDTLVLGFANGTAIAVHAKGMEYDVGAELDLLEHLDAEAALNAGLFTPEEYEAFIAEAKVEEEAQAEAHDRVEYIRLKEKYEA